MLPLYAARIEHLGQGDFVKVDCAACHHVALLAPEFLLRLGLSPQAKVLDLKERVRCRGCGKRGRGPWFRSSGGGGARRWCTTP
jgi:ribosomal protein S27E